MVLPGMFVTGVGFIYKDATFHAINQEGGWCNYALRLVKEGNKGYMVYYCKQWLSLKSPLVSLIAAGKFVMVSGCWEINKKKQTDGTTTVYNGIQVSRLVFLDDSPEAAENSPAKIKSKPDLSGEAPW